MIFRNNLLIVYLLALFARYAFAILSGIDNFSGPDWGRYDLQSDNILGGNYNLETMLFITAPLYPYLVALTKYVFGGGFVDILEGIQIFISAVSVIYLMTTAKILFAGDRVVNLVGVVYALYPITIYYTHQFSQESLFQSLFIISAYYYVKYASYRRIKDLLVFSLLLSIAALTKSHILVVAPFMLFGLFLKHGMNKESVTSLLIVMATVLLVTMPYGIYNKVVNDAYIISSSGMGGHFLTGHNDEFYDYAINTPSRESPEYKKLHGMRFDVYQRLEDETIGMSHQKKQDRYLEEGVRWSMENPQKLFTLIKNNLYKFLIPGMNKAYQPYNLWVLALIFSAPIYALAYFEILRRVISDPANNILILSIVAGMLVFSVVFYYQRRFMVVTIEPFYLMYACSGLVFLMDYFRIKYKIGCKQKKI